MPLRIEVPIEGRCIRFGGGNDIEGDPTDPLSQMNISHFETIYGKRPAAIGVVQEYHDYEPQADGTLKAFTTFVADTADSQVLLNAWLTSNLVLDNVRQMETKFTASLGFLVDGKRVKPPALRSHTVADTPEAKLAIIDEANR